MKLKRLIIHNIASLEDAVIDFDAEPLAGSEVFLITGETGAGKSTILDAICLALYANTPRLKSTGMSGDLQDGSKSVSIKDTTQLMRKNTREAFVRLTFTGSDGNEYESEWSLLRKTKNISRRWCLRNLSHPELSPDEGNGVGGAKDRPIEEAIVRAIGLDFDQFCRTTMLAQGEFTRFLNSDDKQKAEILEKVTGSEIYSAIGAKVYELTSLRERDWKIAKEKIEGVKTLTESETAQIREQIETITAEQAQHQASLNRLQAGKTWLEQLTALTAQLDAGEKALAEAQARVDNDEFRAAQTTIRQYDDTAEVRTHYSQIRTAQQTITEQELSLTRANLQYHELLGASAFEQQRLTQLQQALAQLRQQVADEQPKAELYDNVQTIGAYLKTLTKNSKELQRRQTELIQQQNRRNDILEPAYRRLNDELELLKKGLAEKRQEVASAEKELADLHLMEVHSQRDALYRRSIDLRLISSHITAYVEALRRKTAAQERLATLQQQLEGLKKQIEVGEQKLHDAEIRKNALQQVLDRQKETLDTFAVTMRSRLSQGDRCPICGQTVEHDIPHDEQWRRLVQEAQQAFDTAKNDYEQLAQEQSNNMAQYKVATTSYNALRQEADADTSVHDTMKRLVEQCNKCGMVEYTLQLPLDTDRLATVADDHLLADNSRLEQLNQQLAQGATKEKALEQLRHQYDDYNKKVATQTDTLAAQLRQLNDNEAAIKSTQSAMQVLLSDINAAKDGLEPYMPKLELPDNWLENTDMIYQQLVESSNRYKNNQAAIVQKESECVILDTQLRQVQNAISAIEELQPDWRGHVSTITPQRVEHTAQKATDLLSTVTTAVQIRRQALSQIDAAQQQIAAFVSRHDGMSAERVEQLCQLAPAYISALRERQTALLTDLQQQKSLCRQTLQQYNEHQQRKPEGIDELTQKADTQGTDASRLSSVIAEALAREQHAISLLSERKGALDRQLTDDMAARQQLGELIDMAEHKKQDYERWNRLCSLIGDKDGTKFRRIAQGYILANLVQSANVYMQRLTNRYLLRSVPGTFIIMVEDVYQGYVARPASTISGGESFLVSLALALALSDIGQNLRVETLFIDEGFGTLSGEPLLKAIATLRSLRKHAGRQVGIISHIEEVRERIPVQIQVLRDNNRSAAKVHVVEV